MTLEAKIVALAQVVGGDIKTLTLNQGQLSSLSTQAKGNLVEAINELMGLIGDPGALIDDTAGVGATGVTWSANRIIAGIAAASTALKNELTAGAGEALDTLGELAAALGNDPNFASTIATGLGTRVRFDAAQALTDPQKVQARTNIGALAAADIGNTERDFAAVYTAAKV